MRGFASFSKCEYWRVEPRRVWNAAVECESIETAIARIRTDSRGSTRTGVLNRPAAIAHLGMNDGSKRGVQAGVHPRGRSRTPRVRSPGAIPSGLHDPMAGGVVEPAEVGMAPTTPGSRIRLAG